MALRQGSGGAEAHDVLLLVEHIDVDQLLLNPGKRTGRGHYTANLDGKANFLGDREHEEGVFGG